MGEGSVGSLERAGVVLTALDEFSANMQKYMGKLSEVETRQEALINQQHAAASAGKVAQKSFDVSGEKVMKYGMAASVVTGQMQALGVSNEVVGRGVSIATEAFTGMLGPMGLAIVAAGAMAAVVMDIVTAEDRATKAMQGATEAMVARIEKTKILTELDRYRLDIGKANLELEIKDLQQKKEQSFWSRAKMETEAELLRIIGEEDRAQTLYGANMKLLTASDMARNETLQARIDLLTRIQSLESGYDVTQKPTPLISEEEAERVRQENEKRETERFRADVERFRYRIYWRLNLTEVEMAHSKTMSNLDKKRILAFADQDKADKKRHEAKLVRDKIEEQKEAEALVRKQKATQAIIAQQQILGDAIAAAAAGQADAWKQAAAAEIRIAQQVVVAKIAMKAYEAFASGDIIRGAALVAAGIAVQAVGSMAISELTSQRGGGGAGGGGTDYGYRSNGPSYSTGNGGLQSGPGDTYAQSLTLNIGANVSPGNAGAWKQEAQKWLDEQMPRYEKRRRQIGAA